MAWHSIDHGRAPAVRPGPPDMSAHAPRTALARKHRSGEEQPAAGPPAAPVCRIRYCICGLMSLLGYHRACPLDHRQMQAIHSIRSDSPCLMTRHPGPVTPGTQPSKMRRSMPPKGDPRQCPCRWCAESAASDFPACDRLRVSWSTGFRSALWRYRDQCYDRPVSRGPAPPAATDPNDGVESQRFFL